MWGGTGWGKGGARKPRRRGAAARQPCTYTNSAHPFRPATTSQTTLPALTVHDRGQARGPSHHAHRVVVRAHALHFGGPNQQVQRGAAAAQRHRQRHLLHPRRAAGRWRKACHIQRRLADGGRGLGGVGGVGGLGGGGGGDLGKEGERKACAGTLRDGDLLSMAAAHSFPASPPATPARRPLSPPPHTHLQLELVGLLLVATGGGAHQRGNLAQLLVPLHRACRGGVVRVGGGSQQGRLQRGRNTRDESIQHGWKGGRSVQRVTISCRAQRMSRCSNYNRLQAPRPALTIRCRHQLGDCHLGAARPLRVEGGGR